MSEPNWTYFRSHAPTPEVTFERTVTKRLFCSTLGIQPENLTCPDGYAGIECHPIETSQGWAGYQTKYSHDGKQNVGEFSCLSHAFDGKARGEYQLDVIYCYSAGKPPRKPTIIQKEIESMAAVHEVKLVWRFAEQILEQLRDTTDLPVIRARREFFEETVQPNLTRPVAVANPQGASQYHFTQRATPLLGRASELDALRMFLDSDRPVSWWGLIGKGGSGKSRLMLELGKYLGDQWRWGWLTEPILDSFDFGVWQPNKDTLLIVDYAIGREAQLGVLFNQLHQLAASGELYHYVRVLIIERDIGQWLKTLSKLPTIGPWVESILHPGELLSIAPLTTTGLMELSESIIAGIAGCVIDPQVLVERALSISPDRAPLIMQLLASSPPAESSDRIELIRTFIDRDREYRWDAAHVTDEDIDMLAVSTMCGGVDLATTNFSSADSQEYFAAFSDFDRHAIMTGEASTPDRLNALEPDLFGELFVLEHLNSHNPLSDRPRRLLELAASVNQGRSLISFFSKCRDDYPAHPAFALLKTAWASDQGSFLVWSILVSNVVDVASIDEAQKLDIFRAIAGTRKIFDPVFLLVEQVLFVRLLSCIVSGSRCYRYLGKLEIADEVIVPTEPTAANFLEQLYPEFYCDDVITDFQELDGSLQISLLGPHLVTVYHHKLMHRLSDRGVDLPQSLSFYHELTGLLDANSSHNYVSSISAFHHLCQNVVASLCQFNHHRTDAELCLQTAESIKDTALRLSSTQYNEQPVVLRTTMLDRIDRAISVLVTQTRGRNYQYLLDLIQALEQRSPGPGSNAASARNFVETSVQLAHGFESEQQYADYQVIYEKCMEYADRYPSEQMASALGMIHVQLFRNPLPYVPNEESQSYLVRAIDLAKRFPSEGANVLKPVLDCLSTSYRSAMVEGEIEKGQRLQGQAIELLLAVGPLGYSQQGRVWCGDLIAQGLFAYVKDSVPFESTRRLMDVLKEAPFIAFQECLHSAGLPSELFNQGQRAFNGNDQAGLLRSIECIELLSHYLPELVSNQMLDILVRQAEGRE